MPPLCSKEALLHVHVSWVVCEISWSWSHEGESYLRFSLLSENSSCYRSLHRLELQRKTSVLSICVHFTQTLSILSIIFCCWNFNGGIYVCVWVCVCVVWVYVYVCEWDSPSCPLPCLYWVWFSLLPRWWSSRCWQSWSRRGLSKRRRRTEKGWASGLKFLSVVFECVGCFCKRWEGNNVTSGSVHIQWGSTCYTHNKHKRQYSLFSKLCACTNFTCSLEKKNNG